MGVSTNGQLCYGVMFDEDYEFPWGHDNIDDWWIIETGWQWNGEAPFTEDGDFAPGFHDKDPRINAYFDSQRAWKKAHPLPAEEVNYCSGECPAYILAVPSSVIVARRGYPKMIDPTALAVGDQVALLEFCRRYGLEGEPHWYLSSYWG